MNIKTKLIKLTEGFDYNFASVNPPIYNASTVLFETIEVYEKAVSGKSVYPLTKNVYAHDYAYGTSGTPTQFVLQELLANLHGGTSCTLTPSGLGAISLTYLSFLKAGDHLLLVDNCYFPNRRFVTGELKNLGIEFSFLPPDASDVSAYIKPSTKLIFLESPGSFTFEVQDIAKIVKLARQKNIITVFDNSFSSFINFRPLEHGIDICIEAITKYISGGSDVLMGAVITNDKYKDAILKTKRNYGICVSSFDAYLALRGIRTIVQRLEVQNKTLNSILSFLSKHQKIKHILTPCYKKNQQHSLYNKYFEGSAPLFSIILHDKYAAKTNQFINNLKLFGIGASWGGFKSLVLTSNVSYRTFETPYKNSKIIRIYLGLEDEADIVADLKQALDSI